MMNTLESIRTARRCGTPLLVVRTADPAATIQMVVEAAGNGDKTPPMLRWDIVRGATGINPQGNATLTKALKDSNDMDQSATVNPTEFLNIAKKVAAKSIIFMLNLHRVIDDSGPVQALWNLRDEFKKDGRTVIGLCPNIALPAELAQDVLIIDEPLPTDADLLAIAKNIYAYAELPEPDEAMGDRIVDATLGLAAFPAEQSMAMSITKDGMDLEELWQKKRAVVEQTPGLSVWRGGETFKDIGGCDNVKDFLKDVIAGNQPPRAIVFIDEIEKSIGTGQDTSGVSQSMLGTLLSWMQDNAATGAIFIGPPGAAKSAIAKATGNEAGIPTISLDMGAMKGSLVGESEQRFRQALKVIDAVSQKRTLFIATCVDGETVVQAGDGALRSIKDMRNMPVISFNSSGHPTKEQSLNFKEKKAAVIQIESSAPDLICTEDHVIFKWGKCGVEEVQACFLKPKDWLATPRNVPFGNNHMNPDLSWLLGYTCGDGNLSAKRIQWSESNLNLVAEIERCAISALNEPVQAHRRKNQNSNLIYSVTNGSVYRGISEYIDVCQSGSNRRSIPTAVSSGDASTCAAFLSGLFDADGTASKTKIAMAVVSRKLRDQVYMMLRRFGILATCGTYKPKAPRQTVYVLTICGDNAVTFANKIGFRSPQKQRLAMAINPRPLIGKRGRTIDRIPVDIAAMKACGYRPSRHHPNYRKDLRNPHGNSECIERYVLEEVNRRMASDGLNTRTVSSWLAFDWSCIKRITRPNETRLVYDIEVPQNHNFYGSGLLLHNCNSIGVLPPELRRRFTFGTFFFPCPSSEERKLIWDIYRQKYSIPESDSGISTDDGWTGAEIKQCCDLAFRLKRSLEHCASYIVPVSISAADQIRRLEEQADGKFISASYPGLYRREQQADAGPVVNKKTGPAISFGE